MTVFQMPFYFVQEETLEDKKKKWMSEHAHENKRITPDFEPIPGWKPLAEYGSTPAQIIAHCVRNKDFSVLHVGDYLNETVNGTTYRWTFTEFNHYGQNEALMVPDKLIPGNYAFGANNTYSGSNLENELNKFYNAIPYFLRDYIIRMDLNWTGTGGSMFSLQEHVFPPSEIEAFGSAYYSNDSPYSYNKWACFTDANSRARDGRTYWLRSAYTSDSLYVVDCDNGGNLSAGRAYMKLGILPCFCIGGGKMSKPTPPEPEPDPGDGDWI